LIAVFGVLFVAVGLLIGWAWGGSWAFSIGVAVVAGAIAFFLTLGSYFGGASAVLGMSRAHEIVKADDP